MGVETAGVCGLFSQVTPFPIAIEFSTCEKRWLTPCRPKNDPADGEKKGDEKKKGRKMACRSPASNRLRDCPRDDYSLAHFIRWWHLLHRLKESSQRMNDELFVKAQFVLFPMTRLAPASGFAESTYRSVARGEATIYGRLTGVGLGRRRQRIQK